MVAEHKITYICVGIKPGHFCIALTIFPASSAQKYSSDIGISQILEGGEVLWLRG
jgi:hypothetical protein